MGRRVEAGAVAGGSEDTGQGGSGRSFAVGSSDQYRGKGGLRVPERRSENSHVGEVELAAGRAGCCGGKFLAQSIEMVDRCSVGHVVILGDGADLNIATGIGPG